MTLSQPQDEPDQNADYYIPSITAALNILREFHQNVIDGPWTYHHDKEKGNIQLVGTEWTPDGWPLESHILNATFCHKASLRWLTIMNPGLIAILIQLMENILADLQDHAHPEEVNLIAEQPEKPCPHESMVGQLAAKIVFAYQNLPDNEVNK